MGKNYAALVQKLKQRSNPDSILESRLYSAKFNEDIGKITYNSALEYVRRSMKGVSLEYTNKSIKAGENVKDHLDQVLSKVKFEFQGSVMTNTHIVGNSDIDLLVISEKSYYYNRILVKNHFDRITTVVPVDVTKHSRLKNVLDSSDYTGDTLGDLKKNRIDSEMKLKSVYDKCNFEKPKAIEISNKNLNRDVDIVIAIWHHTPEYISTQNSDQKKITIYDKDNHSTGRLESPFLSIKRINERDSNVNGRLKRMIRFLKNVKYDSVIEDIPLTSFEINAICYGIEPSKYFDKNFLELVVVIYNQLNKLINDIDYRNSLLSVDGSESIFNGKIDKIEGLRQLLLEVDSIAKDILNEIETVKLLRA